MGVAHSYYSQTLSTILGMRHVCVFLYNVECTSLVASFPGFPLAPMKNTNGGGGREPGNEASLADCHHDRHLHFFAQKIAGYISGTNFETDQSDSRLPRLPLT